MPIKINLQDSKTYRLNIAPGSIYQEEKKLITDLPVKQAIWEYNERHKCDMMSHWEVPRQDIGEILRRWPEEEDIQAGDFFWRDARIYRKYDYSLEDKYGQFKGDIDFSRPPKNDQQEGYVRTDPSVRRMLCGYGTGRGKTWCTLERCKFLGTSRLFVVTILNMLDDWESEIKQTFGDAALIYQGPKRKKLDVNSAKFVIATYQTAHEVIFPDPPYHFDQFIFDEADMAINHTSKTWARIQNILDTATWKTPGIGVQPATATPFNNVTEGLWTALYMIHPYLAGTVQGFRNRHQLVETWRDQVVKRVTDDGKVVFRTVKVANKVVAQNKKSLQKKLGTAIVRDNDDFEFDFKEDPRIIDCPMTAEQQRVFKALRDKAVIELDGGELDTSKMKNRLQKQMQCCEGLFHFKDENEESSKLDFVRRVLCKCVKEGKKVAIWSIFRPGLDILAEEFMDYGVPYNGDMNREQKQLAKWAFCGCDSDVDEAKFKSLAKKYGFRMKPGEALFWFGVINKSTSRGLNLHKMCSFSIYMSIHDSAPTMVQTYGRFCRLGQQAKKVTTWYLLTESQTERLRAEMVLGKQKDSKLLLDGKQSIGKDQTVKLMRQLRRDKLEGGLLK